jgi:hypothetical protein
MSEEPRPKRTKKYLLTAVALTTGTMLVGCGSQSSSPEPTALPGNPKGSVYDEATQQVEEPPPEEEEREAEPQPEPVPPQHIPLPANPKGAVYDDGVYDDHEPRRG